MLGEAAGLFLAPQYLLFFEFTEPFALPGLGICPLCRGLLDFRGDRRPLAAPVKLPVPSAPGFAVFFRCRNIVIPARFVAGCCLDLLLIDGHFLGVRLLQFFDLLFVEVGPGQLVGISASPFSPLLGLVGELSDRRLLDAIGVVVRILVVEFLLRLVDRRKRRRRRSTGIGPFAQPVIEGRITSTDRRTAIFDGLRHIDQQFVVQQLLDDLKGRRVVEWTVVDDLSKFAVAVEEPDDPLDFGGKTVEEPGKSLVVGLQNPFEIREIRDQLIPLIESTHPLHQKRRRVALDVVGSPHVVAIAHDEMPGRPPHDPVDRLFALELATDGIQHVAVAKIDGSLTPPSIDPKRSGPQLLLDRLQQIDHRDVIELPLHLLDVGLAQLLLGPSLNQQFSPGQHLVDVDRLRQIIVGSQLEGPHLLFERPVFGQKDQRDLRRLFIEFQIGTKLEPIAVGKSSIGDNQRRAIVDDIRLGIGDRVGDLDPIARLLEADLEHLLALRFGVDYQNRFVRHGNSLQRLGLNRREPARNPRCESDQLEDCRRTTERTRAVGTESSSRLLNLQVTDVSVRASSVQGTSGDPSGRRRRIADATARRCRLLPRAPSPESGPGTDAVARRLGERYTGPESAVI